MVRFEVDRMPSQLIAHGGISYESDAGRVWMYEGHDGGGGQGTSRIAYRSFVEMLGGVRGRITAHIRV